MSTNNFRYENVLIKIPDFMVYHTHDSCEKDCLIDTDEGEYDQFYYDEYVKEVQDQLAKIGFDRCDKWNRDRDYSGTIISRYGIEDTDGMIVYVEIVIRSGYYDGANIDYTIDGDFGIESEKNKKQVAHYQAMHRKLDRLVAKTVKILRKNGTELLKVAQFSNGEAIYNVKK